MAGVGSSGAGIARSGSSADIPQIDAVNMTAFLTLNDEGERREFKEQCKYMISWPEAHQMIRVRIQHQC